jgi:hypothetical protein
MTRFLLAFVAFAWVSAFAAPQYRDIVLSEQKKGPAVSVFKPDTPLLYLNAKLADVPDGAILRGEWIAVKTTEAPPNYKILAKELPKEKNWGAVEFTLSKPGNGWPAGDYRVDLFIDGKPAGSVPFKVAAAGGGAAPSSGAARYENVVMSDRKRGPPMKEFKPSTAKIYVDAAVSGASEGTLLKAQWIAEKVEGAPPDYAIDTTELKVKKNTDSVEFRLSKPNKGWPIGTYRVELLVDGKVVQKLSFRVSK